MAVESAWKSAASAPIIESISFSQNMLRNEGGTVPPSGPVEAFGVLGRALADEAHDPHWKIYLF